MQQIQTNKKTEVRINAGLPSFTMSRGSRIRTRMNGFGDRDTSHCMIPLYI